MDAPGAAIRPVTVWRDAREGDPVSDRWLDPKPGRAAIKVHEGGDDFECRHRAEREPYRSSGS